MRLAFQVMGKSTSITYVDMHRMITCFVLPCYTPCKILYSSFYCLCFCYCDQGFLNFIDESGYILTINKYVYYSNFF